MLLTGIALLIHSRLPRCISQLQLLILPYVKSPKACYASLAIIAGAL